MTLVGVAWIALGTILSLVLALRLRSPLCIVLFAYHLGASFLYWMYSLSHGADAMSYFGVQYASDLEVRPGSAFITWLTVLLREPFDASYLDMFMLYHLPGYIGVVMLYRLCRRVAVSDDQAGSDVAEEGVGYLPYVVAFLPGLHVWTSAIGKDGLVFLGIMCFVCGVSRPQINLWLLALGLALCAMIRPHVAAMLAASLVCALAFSAAVRPHWRILLIASLIASLVLAMPYLQQFLDLASLDSVTVAEYVERRQVSNLNGGSSQEIANYSAPLRFFTFMYRPLFVDANGVLAFVVSLENLLYLGTSLIYGPRILRALVNSERPLFVRFNFIFWLGATWIFAATTANLGLAIRQKTMVVGSLMVLVVSVYAKKRETESEPVASPAE